MIRSGFNIFGSFTDSTNMESGTADVLSKIKFIGRWQKGDKINVKYLYVQPDSWWTRLSRTFIAADNRNNTFQFADSTLKRCFEIITLNKNSQRISERCLVVNLISDMKRALEGIENLKATYFEDVMFCCKLETLIQETTGRIIEIEQEILPEHDSQTQEGTLDDVD